jgi:hypothetical protein
MAAWRMAFRNGTNGPEMWPACHDLSVAAIGRAQVSMVRTLAFSKEKSPTLSRHEGA